MSSRLTLIALMLALYLSPLSSHADHSLVLIARYDSPLTTISSLDLRKLYLGFVVNSAAGRQIHPISNNSDSRVREVFLQDVVGMSARTYDRRLLTLTLQTGRHRPETFTDLEDVLNRITENPLAIAFVWREDIEDRDDVKILRVLWQR